jgi:hypothetical protein
MALAKIQIIGRKPGILIRFYRTTLDTRVPSARRPEAHFEPLMASSPKRWIKNRIFA